MITISNTRLANPKFWEALTTVMSLKELPIGAKLGLAKLKSQILIEVDTVRVVLKDANEDDRYKLMSTENEFKFSPIEVPMETLSADELFQLEGIYKYEE